MTSKVNGKREILAPCISETPENIETKIGLNDYVMDPYLPTTLPIFMEISQTGSAPHIDLLN